MTTEINTLEDFKVACERHDLTYMMSDDHRYWLAGTASHERIQEAAKKFPRADVVRIWNEVVDTKMVENARSMFYWKE